MTAKMIGAIFVLLSCGTFGFSVAAKQHKEIILLRAIIMSLNEMENELMYKLTPLPSVCRQVANRSVKPISAIFASLAEELDRQIMADVSRCMDAVLNRFVGLPDSVNNVLINLGGHLGRFDLPGQLGGINAVRSDCQQTLKALEQGKTERLRGYKTLGLCTGAALIILFV